MHEKRSHKVSRSALALSLAACLAVCVTVAPKEKAYADTATEGLLQSILSGQGGIRNQIDNIYASLGPLSADGNTYATIVECCNAIYDYLQSDSSVSSGVAGCYRVLGLIRSDLTTLSWLYIYLTAQTDTVTIDGTTLNTPRYYLKYLHTIANNQQFLLEAIDTLWQADSYMDENQQTHFTPYYYLKQIYNSLYRNNTTVATFLDGIRDNTYTTRNTVTTISNALSSLGTAVNTLNTTLSNIEYYIIKIQQAVVDNYQNNTSGVQVQTIKQLVNQVKDNLSYNSTSAAGFLYSINNKMDTLHSDLNYSGQSAASYLYGIYDATQTIIDYLIRLANNTSAPSPNVADSLIGEFDMDAFDENMETLNAEIAGIGVFGCITVLGTYIEIMTDVEELQKPQLVFPFEFGGFQNQSVTVDVSWLDDLKPAINYFLEFMLVMGLTFLTWEAVKET